MLHFARIAAAMTLLHLVIEAEKRQMCVAFEVAMRYDAMVMDSALSVEPMEAARHSKVEHSVQRVNLAWPVESREAARAH